MNQGVVTKAFCRGYFMGFLLTSMLLLGSISVAMGDDLGPSSAASPVASPTVTPAPGDSASFSLANIPSEVLRTNSSMTALEEITSSESVGAVVIKGLNLLAGEIRRNQIETRRALSRQLSLDELKDLEQRWESLQSRLTRLNDGLINRIGGLGEKLTEIEKLRRQWLTTQEQAKTTNAPQESINQVSVVLARLRKTTELLQQVQADAVNLQSRLFERGHQIETGLRSVRQARNSLADNLFVADLPPLWRISIASQDTAIVGLQEGNNFSGQLSGLLEYLSSKPGALALHALLFLPLLGAAFWLRSYFRAHIAERRELLESTEVLGSPVLLAFVLTSVAGIIIYPDAPDLLWLCAAPVIIPASSILLSRILHDAFDPIIYGLAGFYFLDLLRPLLPDLTTARFLFIIELLLGALFTKWLLRRRVVSSLSYSDSPRMQKLAVLFARLSALLLSAAAALNITGYGTLSYLFGNLIFRSAYTVLFICAAAKVLTGLFVLTLEFPPFSLLRMVATHKELIQRRGRRFIQYGALLFAIVSVRQGAAPFLSLILNLKMKLGSLELSLGNLLFFVLTIWATFTLSRFIQFVLNQEVFPRAALSRGLPYAISTVTHYSILFVGFLLGIAILGLDMTKFVVLAGAFSVGLGFGLQNIINNFFSGLIVLFERPVRVGDVIQLGEIEGVVERIGIRASFIRTVHGSEVIVPNAKLISEQVTNWTYSNRRRAIEIPVGISLESDAEKVITLMLAAALENPLISRDPEPEAVATKIGAESLQLILRVYTDYFTQWSKIRSDLTLRIHSALNASGIVLK